MKSGLSLNVMIIDASSSMSPRRTEVISSVNEAIKKHRETEGEALISIYQFNHQVKNVLDFKNVNDVADFTYECGGMTAMYDGIGVAIDEIGKKLSEIPESLRPELIQVMIITDGEENSSSKYSASKIKEMIEHQTSKYSWIFTYLGSNQDAITTGSVIGIGAMYCANYTDSNLSTTVRGVTGKMSFNRSILSKGGSMADVAVNSAYTSVERKSFVN